MSDKNSRRYRLCLVSESQLLGLLRPGREVPMLVVEGAPEDARFRGLKYLLDRGCFALLLEHDSWPEVAQYAEIPQFTATYEERYPDGMGTLRRRIAELEAERDAAVSRLQTANEIVDYFGKKKLEDNSYAKGFRDALGSLRLALAGAGAADAVIEGIAPRGPDDDRSLGARILSAGTEAHP